MTKLQKQRKMRELKQKAKLGKTPKRKPMKKVAKKPMKLGKSVVQENKELETKLSLLKENVQLKKQLKKVEVKKSLTSKKKKSNLLSEAKQKNLKLKQEIRKFGKEVKMKDETITEGISYPTTYVNGIEESLGLSHLNGRREDFENYIKAENDDVDIYEYDELQEAGYTDLSPYHELGLSWEYNPIDKYEDSEEDSFTFLLSTGGPADGINFYKDGKIEFFFQDWGTGIGFDVTGDDVFEWVAERMFANGIDYDFQEAREADGYDEKMMEKEYGSERAEMEEWFDEYVEGSTYVDTDDDEEVDIEDYKSEIVDELIDGLNFEDIIMDNWNFKERE